MNKERLSYLKGIYLPALTESIAKYPQDYMPGSDPETIANKIFGAIERSGDIGSISIDSRSWKATSKALGIKHTRKAFTEYLECGPKWRWEQPKGEDE